MPSNWCEGYSGTVGGLEYGLWHGKMQKRLRDVAQQLRGLQCYCSPHHTSCLTTVLQVQFQGLFVTSRTYLAWGRGFCLAWGNLSGLQGICLASMASEHM